MKSRGMNHSNQVREFVITSNGLNLVEVFLGGEGVLIGSARAAYALQEETGKALRNQALKTKEREMDRKNRIIEGKIAELKLEFESAREELTNLYYEEELIKENVEKYRKNIASLRKGGNIIKDIAKNKSK